MRRLAIASISFSAAIFAANYILPLRALPFIAAGLVLLGLGLVFFRRRWLLLFEIILVSAGLGLAVFAINAQMKAVPATKLDGQTVTVECRVLDYPIIYEDYARLDVKLDIDGYPRLKAILYDNSLEMTHLTPGDIVRLEARLKSADTRYGKDYDYYNSKEIFLIASSKSSPEFIYDGFHISGLPAIIRHGIADLIDDVFPEDSSAFMRSLLLGDKSGLYDDVSLYTDLNRAGFMHVTAVSGMHIAFLVGLLQLFFGCSAKSSAISIVLVWAFAVFTGSSPSAIRAAFMQSVLLMAPVVRRENDAITSLGTVLAIVLAVNPYAASSVGLQLSFGAMAGILCFNEPISNILCELIPGERIEKLLHYPLGVLSVSLSVLPFTLILTAVHFGELAILSPLSNIAALWVVSACFCGGVVCCVLALVSIPVAIFGAKLVSLLARYIFIVADFFASAPFAVVYISGAVMWLWLIVSYIVFAIMGISRSNSWVKLLFPMALSAMMLVAAQGAIRLSYTTAEGTIAVLDVGQGQSIAAISADNCVLVDCGGGAKMENAGEIAGEWLLTRGIDKVDCLMLTHLHSDHANGVLNLLEYVRVEEIILPENPMYVEDMLTAIVDSARRHGTTVRYIGEDSWECFGSISLEMFEPNDSVDVNEACLACRLYVNDFDLLITADGSTAAENELLRTHELEGVDVLVVGHHGSRYSSGANLLKALGADTAVISVGYNNYGHPTYETLERLDAYGYNIYRTDLNGTVEFRIGKNNG